MHQFLAILVVFQTLADRVPDDGEASSVLQSFSSKTGQHDQHSGAAASGLTLDQFRLRLLSEYDASNQTDMAIVTHICDAQWAPGAMALAQSLKKAGTKYNLVLLITSDFDERYHKLFAHLFDKVYVEEPLKEHPSILRPGADCLTLQLRCWQLPYRKVLYMDADMIALKSHDSVLEESTELTARSDVDVTSQFNGGLFVMEPAESTFEKLRTSLATFQPEAGSHGGMQHFLNHFFPSCEQPSKQDVGCWKGKLSDEYNVYTRDIYDFDSEINSNKYFSLHYSGDWGQLKKPWMPQCLHKSESVTRHAGTERQRKLLSLWMDTFRSVSLPSDLADLVHTECELRNLKF